MVTQSQFFVLSDPQMKADSRPVILYRKSGGDKIEPDAGHPVDADHPRPPNANTYEMPKVQ